MTETEQYRTALETIAAGNTDAAKLAAAALDDSTMDITPEWLDETLKRHASGNYWEIPNSWHHIYRNGIWPDSPFVCGRTEEDGDETFICTVETRGDVRRLLLRD